MSSPKIRFSSMGTVVEQTTQAVRDGADNQCSNTHIAASVPLATAPGPIQVDPPQNTSHPAFDPRVPAQLLLGEQQAGRRCACSYAGNPVLNPSRLRR